MLYQKQLQSKRRDKMSDRQTHQEVNDPWSERLKAFKAIPQITDQSDEHFDAGVEGVLLEPT